MARNFGVSPKDLIEKVYEAAFVSELWPGVLKDLGTMIGGSGAVLFSARPGQVKQVSSDAEFEAVANAYFETFQDKNERMRRLIASNHAGFLTDGDVFTPIEMETHPIFRDFLRPRGLGFGTATLIALPEDEMAVLHCEGSPAGNGAVVAAVPMLDRLRPHLARAAMLSARLAFEKTRTSVETLERLGLAACAISATGAVLIANAAFDKEIAYWTTRRKDMIVLKDRSADLLLQAALTASASGLNGSVFSVPLRATKRAGPAVLHLVPVRQAARDLFSQATAILVLTKASGSLRETTAPLLQLLFDLTAAESRVATSLGNGKTVDEIAAMEGKSVNTVRNQLSRVMVKTGCRRQAYLVLLLAQLLPW